MKFTGQIRIPDLDHPGVPATFLVDGNQAEVILEGEESLGRWSLFDVQARRLISAAFEVELDGEEITFIADEPMDFAYRGLEEMASVWARFKSMNIVRRKVAVSRSRSGSRPSRIDELRSAMEENLGIRAKSVSLPGTSGRARVDPEVGERHVWDRPTRDKPDESTVPVPEPAATGPEPEEEPTIPVVSAPPRAGTGEEEAEGAAGSPLDDETALAEELAAIEEEKARLEEQLRATSEKSNEVEASLDAERRALEEEKARLEERLRLTEQESDEVAASLAEERKAIEEERERLAEERRRLEEMQLEAERRESDRVEAFRLEMQRLERERMEFEQREEERQEAHRQAMRRLEAEREEIEKKTAEVSEREQAGAERTAELQSKLADLEKERVRREQEESERVEAARKEMEAIEEQRRRIESLEELEEDKAARGVEPSTDAADVTESSEVAQPEVDVPEQVPAAAVDSEVVDLAELEERVDDDEEKGGPKHLRDTSRRRRPAKRDSEPVPEPVSPPIAETAPDTASLPDHEPEFEPEPAMAGASKQSGIMGAVRAAFGRGGREHVHDFVEAPGGLGIARSICRECGYVSISTED